MPPSLAVCPAALLALQIAAPAEAPQLRFAIEVGAVRAAAGCPDAREITDALEARMPGAAAGGRAPDGAHLRLDLVPAGEGGGARLTLTDDRGTLVLERALDLAPAAAAPPRERSDCAALADTVALIVERYVRHIGYREQPPPATALRAPALPATAPTAPAVPPMLGAGLTLRPGRRGPWRSEPGVMVEVHLGQLAISASLAFTPSVSVDVPRSTGGTFQLMAVPARLGAGWVIPVHARAWLAPTVAAGADLLLTRTEAIGTTARSTSVEPVAEAGAAATVALSRRAWLRLQLLQGVDLRPQQFTVNGGVPPQQQVVFMTPRLFLRAGLDFGLFLFPR